MATKTPSPGGETRTASEASGTGQTDEKAKAGNGVSAQKPAEGSRDESTSSETSGSAGPGTQKAGNRKAERRDSPAIALLKAEHRAVEGMFDAYESADRPHREELIHQACRALIAHTMLEEDIFYPACRRAVADDDPLDEAQVEHDVAKTLILDLLHGPRNDPFRDAKFRVLAEQIRHHIREEEGEGGIFAKARAHGVDTPALGERLQARKDRLDDRDELPDPQPVAIRLPHPDRLEYAATRGPQAPPSRYRGEDDRREDWRGNRRGESRGHDDRDRYDDRSSPRDEHGRFLGPNDRLDSDDRWRSRHRDEDKDDYRYPGGSSREARGHAGAPRGGKLDRR